MNYDIRVPLAWDAIRGEDVCLTFKAPPLEVLLSDGPITRLERIFVPLRFVAKVAVDEAVKRSHDDDEARWHQNRPALKTCPYDEACRFA